MKLDEEKLETAGVTAPAADDERRTRYRRLTLNDIETEMQQ
jgi:hypothetical protein